MSNKKYILYYYDKIKDDFIYCKEYTRADKIKAEFNIVNVKHYYTSSLDDVKHLLNNKYIIFIEKEGGFYE